jgi:hypothetical protein
MTADALQSIPLKIVGRLKCGDPVTLLTDIDDYAVGVQAPDGTTGYVAGMYLTKSKPALPHLDSAQVRNGVARWKEGTQGSEKLSLNGVVVESLTAGGVTVQVSLTDTGTKLRADIVIANATSQNAYANPVGVTLEGIDPRWKAIRSSDSAAAEASRPGFWSAASTVLAKDADKSPAVPATPTEGQPEAPALKAGNIGPNQKAAGAVWFERDEESKRFIMRVPVDNQVFEFPLWSSDQNKVTSSK